MKLTTVVAGGYAPPARGGTMPHLSGTIASLKAASFTTDPLATPIPVETVFAVMIFAFVQLCGFHTKFKIY